MQKKRSKKSWRRHQKRGCYCYLCMGDDKRLNARTKARKKYLKYPQKLIEEQYAEV